MLSLLAASLFVWQEPEPRPDPKPAAEAPAAPAVEVWDDKTARANVRAFAKVMKARPGMGERQRALAQLLGGSNPRLIKPLAEVVAKDASVVIRKQAVTLLANQPADKANGVIRRLLADGDVTENPQVHAELIRALSRCGYEPKHWDELDLDRAFGAYGPERVPVHEAILDLVVAHEEKRALPLLLNNLDEPIPENVDDATNPPADYWKARWQSWAVWRGRVKDALFAVTGQRFSTADEAKAWLEKNKIE